MDVRETKKTNTPKTFDPKGSIKRAKVKKSKSARWSIQVSGSEYSWNSSLERIALIRRGVPYESIETISKRLNVPLHQFLVILNVPQTTYNKKKRDKELLSRRDSEVVLKLIELLDFGLEVFNHEEEKFQRWLKKANISLGGVTPESLFDSLTGIQEVRNALNRIEYGNMA